MVNWILLCPISISILCPFGNLVAISYKFYYFGTLNKEKSGNPAVGSLFFASSMKTANASKILGYSSTYLLKFPCTKNGSGYILGDFFTSSSGRPGRRAGISLASTLKPLTTGVFSKESEQY
jgi:hypothetical protein